MRGGSEGRGGTDREDWGRRPRGREGDKGEEGDGGEPGEGGRGERALLPPRSSSLLTRTPPGSLVHHTGLYIFPIFPVFLTRYPSPTLATNTPASQAP